jgi:UDP-glucose 4-epimerase
VAGRVPKKALVIGLGFIGRRIAEVWSREGVEVVALTRSEPEKRVRDSLPGRVVVGDAADRELVAATIDGVDHVVYAAGGLMPSESEANPVRDVELTFPPLLATLEAVTLAPTIQLTVISSGGTVYGRPQILPINEEHPTTPISNYGVVKLAAEKFVTSYAATKGLRARILRCSNAFGERQPTHRDQGVIGTFLRQHREGQPVVLYGDGSILRDYVYVDDVALAALALAALPVEPRIVNVGSGRGHSLLEIIDAIERLSGKAVRIERRPPRQFDLPEIVLDISRLQALIEYEPLSLVDGIARLLGGRGVAARIEAA